MIFELEKESEIKMDKFMRKHNRKHRKIHSQARFEIIISLFAIGDGFSIRCNDCGKEEIIQGIQ